MYVHLKHIYIFYIWKGYLSLLKYFCIDIEFKIKKILILLTKYLQVA